MIVDSSVAKSWRASVRRADSVYSVALVRFSVSNLKPPMIEVSQGTGVRPVAVFIVSLRAISVVVSWTYL